MIEKIRNNIKSMIGLELLFRYHGSRNQLEEFTGFISQVYPNVFLVSSNSVERVRSFSYSDVLIGNLEIKNVNLCKSLEKD